MTDLRFRIKQDVRMKRDIIANAAITADVIRRHEDGPRADPRPRADDAAGSDMG